jgi:hypothetical protein
VNALITADNAIFGGADVTGICNEMKGARGINASACP